MRQLPVIPLWPAIDDGESLSVVSGDWAVRTFQGEGIFTGMPSLFLRLFGCNLSCENCDTQYTWHPDKAKARHDLTMQQAIEHIESRLRGLRHLVVTGGEPLLQVNALISILHAIDFDGFTTIETNGTIFDRLVAENISLISLSPKIGWMAHHGKHWVPYSVFDWLYSANTTGLHSAQVKLVVEQEGDLAWAIEWLLNLIQKGLLEREHAIIQPEWGRWGTNLKPFTSAIDAGLRVMPQAHKTWGVY